MSISGGMVPKASVSSGGATIVLIETTLSFPPLAISHALHRRPTDVGLRTRYASTWTSNGRTIPSIQPTSNSVAPIWMWRWKRRVPGHPYRSGEPRSDSTNDWGIGGRGICATCLRYGKNRHIAKLGPTAQPLWHTTRCALYPPSTTKFTHCRCRLHHGRTREVEGSQSEIHPLFANHADRRSCKADIRPFPLFPDPPALLINGALALRPNLWWEAKPEWFGWSYYDKRFIYQADGTLTNASKTDQPLPRYCSPSVLVYVGS